MYSWPAPTPTVDVDEQPCPHGDPNTRDAAISSSAEAEQWLTRNPPWRGCHVLPLEERRSDVLADPRKRSFGAADVIGFLVFGLVVGVVARLLVPGRQHLSFWMTLALGVAGSVIGGIVANAIGTGDIFELNVVGSIVAVVAAIALVVVGEQLSTRRQ